MQSGVAGTSELDSHTISLKISDDLAAKNQIRRDRKKVDISYQNLR